MKLADRFLAALATALVALACSEGEPARAPSEAPREATSPSPSPQAQAQAQAQAEPEVDLVAEGKTAYLNNCIACHNPDPKLDGALGPAIAGSSQELIEARVVHGTYPEGYTPKRNTANMVPLPFLAPKIPALAAYLKSEG